MSVQELEGWTALPEAAQQMGLSKQGLHFRVNQGHVPEDSVRVVRTGKRAMVLIANDWIEMEKVFRSNDENREQRLKERKEALTE